MARIQAGSTLVNQYVPPFVVSSGVSDGWELRWNGTLQAFEAYDPSASTTLGGFSEIKSHIETTRASVLYVPWIADSKQSLLITINGVKQNQQAYSIVTYEDNGVTEITLSEELDAISFPTVPTIEVLGLQASDGAQVLVYQETTSDLAQTTFPEGADGTIGWYPPSRESLIITIDGVKQLPSAYFIVPNSTFTGAQIEFVSPPYEGIGASVDVEILGITTTGETIASPVNAANLGNPNDSETFGLFDNKSVSGNEQILSFRSINQGSKINLAPTAGGNAVQISAIEPVFTANITVAGGSGIAVVDTTTPTTPTTVNFRGIVGGDGIAVSANSTDVTIAKSADYATYSGTPVAVGASERVIGLTHTGTAISVTLPALSNFYDGETITVKRENGGTDVITISTAGAETIDGQATYQIASAYGYVTLYKSATQFHVISTSE